MKSYKKELFMENSMEDAKKEYWLKLSENDGQVYHAMRPGSI